MMLAQRILACGSLILGVLLLSAPIFAGVPIIDYNNNDIPDQDEATFNLFQVSMLNPDGSVAERFLNAGFARVNMISPPPDVIQETFRDGTVRVELESLHQRRGCSRTD